MAIDITMPALSPTMEEGTLATWLVKEGDSVSAGDVIAEIETDKATMEVESIDEGVIAKILVDAGTDGVAVGTLIAVMAEEGEDVGDVAASAGSSGGSSGGGSGKSETPAPAPSETDSKDNGEKAPAPSPSPTSAPSAPKTEDGDRIKASPLARRLAKDAGIDLGDVTGSGPGGRIVKADIEGYTPSESKAKAEDKPAAAAPKPSADADYAGPHDDIPFEERKLSNMRKTIARRLTESKTTVPHFYLTIDCDLTALMEQRKALNARLESEGIKISVNDFIIRASALALKKVPAANVQFAGDKMYWYDRADISVAVAIDGGLVTPVVRGADQKGLASIAGEMKDLAGKARDGKLMPEDYAGGTFSISNLGMMGIKEFSAVINPPQGAILAIGAGDMRPVIRDGAVTSALMMSCTLSCDHRAIDGAVGAEFLAAFKGFIEDPLTMLL